MNVEEFLNYIIEEETRIKNKQFEIDQLYSLKSSVIDDAAVHSSNVSDKIGNIVIKILKEKEEVVRMTEAYLQERDKRIALIETLENRLEYDVVHLHYVQGKPFTDIASEVHKSYQYVIEIHGNAKKNLSKHIESYV